MKIKKFFLLLFAAAALVSCGNEEKPSVIRYVIDLDVDQADWEWSGLNDNNYFIASFDMPEMTWDVYDNCVIQVFREYKTGTNRSSQIALPYTLPYEYYVETDTVQNVDLWGNAFETVEFEYGYQYLNLIYRLSDFSYEIDETFVPEDMHFRVVILW